MSFGKDVSEISTDLFEDVYDDCPFVVPASREELLLLARLIQAEAEGEPAEGKVAVGAVVINRLKHPDFPDTIQEVILQPKQFETVSNKRLAKITEPNRDCLEAAYRALKGEDPTNGALFFYNPAGTKNNWLKAKKIKLSLGKHFFA